MNYPLQLSFKTLSLAQEMSVADASGALVFYVKQKAFKLKEAVTVFADAGQTQPLYTMNADKILDFSARYRFADTQENPLGSVKREGFKSLWHTHYEIFDDETPVLTIREENPWVKVIDGIVGEIPFVGMFTGYLFHPAYLVTRPDGTVVMRLEKQPAFFEGKFGLEKRAEMAPEEERRALLSLMMMILIERSSG